MRRLIGAVAFAVSASALCVADPDPDDWQTGIVRDVQDEPYTVHNVTTTDVTRRRGGLHAESRDRGAPRRHWTYTIEVGDHAYVVTHDLSDGALASGRKCKVTINGKVRVRREGTNKLLLVDEEDWQHTLTIERSILNPATGTDRPVTADADETQTSGGEVKKGMSREQVRAVLGAPAREVTFEGKTRWTYPDVVVLFMNDNVVDVEFR
jgi:SmpA/OmlA family protein